MSGAVREQLVKSMEENEQVIADSRRLFESIEKLRKRNEEISILLGTADNLNTNEVPASMNLTLTEMPSSVRPSVPLSHRHPTNPGVQTRLPEITATPQAL